MARLFPIWIGSLPNEADEKDLKSCFQKCGNIESVRVLRDEKGHSKCFGYVNFLRLSDAEAAARLGQLALIRGRKVLVKGPKQLQQEGHLSPPGDAGKASKKSSKDFRPLTDCLFFMEKGGCRDGNRVRIGLALLCVLIANCKMLPNTRYRSNILHIVCLVVPI